MKVDKGFNYAFALSRKWLWLLGVWPDPQIPLSDFRRLNIRFVIMACYLCFYLILPQMIHMFRNLDNVTRIIEQIARMNFFLISLIKLVITCYHGETLRTLITSVMSDWKTTKNDLERNTMLKIARRGKILSLVYYTSAVAANLFYTWFNILKFQRNMPQRILVHQANYPFNVQKSPTYEITCFTQVFSAVPTTIISCTVDSFVSMLILHTCAQLMNLRTALNDIVNERVNRIISISRFEEGLAVIIKRHNNLIKNVKTIDHCYSGVLFMHMLCATVQLCLETFQIFTIILDHINVPVTRKHFLLCYTIYVLSSIYIYCYSGEKLLTESINIAYGVYECKWYDLPSKNAKDLMIIVYRSYIPLKLIAGKFGVFSIELFGTMIRTSMGYVSVLLTIKD